LKKARHEILNEEKKPPKKLKMKNIQINDKYLDDKFKNNSQMQISEDNTLEFPDPHSELGEHVLDDIDIKESEIIKNHFLKSISNSKDEVSPISEREWRKLVGMYNAISDFDPL
jgi:hypothetical protein